MSTLRIRILLLLLLPLLAGCHSSIHTDLTDCPQGTRFTFDILYPQTINYSETVREIRLFAFDEAGRLITEISDKPEAFVPSYSLMSDLYRPGHKTTFYAWGGANLSQYNFDGFKPGTTLGEMTVSLERQGRELPATASPLYAGRASRVLEQAERIGTVIDSVHIDFRQITNHLKITVEGLDPLHSYALRLGAQNSRYSATGKLLKDTPFDYTTTIEEAKGKRGKAIRATYDILKLDPAIPYPVEVIDRTDGGKVVYSFDLLRDYICYDGPFAESANPLRLERNHDFDIWILLGEDKPKGTYFAIRARILDWNLVFRNLDLGK